jgi:hypothetical protein
LDIHTLTDFTWPVRRDVCEANHNFAIQHHATCNEVVFEVPNDAVRETLLTLGSRSVPQVRSGRWDTVQFFVKPVERLHHQIEELATVLNETGVAVRNETEQLLG